MLGTSKKSSHVREVIYFHLKFCKTHMKREISVVWEVLAQLSFIVSMKEKVRILMETFLCGCEGEQEGEFSNGV